MRFYIETFGCTANFGNSEDLAEALSEMGHISSSVGEADLVIVNTCAVTQKTERKILYRLKQLEGERLVVAGCLPAAVPDSIREIRCRKVLGLLDRFAAPTISNLSGGSPSSSLGALPPSPNSPLSALLQPSPVQLSSQPPSAPSSTTGDTSICRIINIAEGCNGSCSYCIVKNARGRLKSRPVGDVVLDAERQATLGAREIQITAQDTAAYGSDLGADLALLLKRLGQIKGDFMIRVGMMNPDSVLLIQDRLAAAFSSPRIYKFIHIPVQSGSDEVLQRMGRRYTAADCLQIASCFRSAYPGIGIITDIIAGFPGETDEDFQESISLVERVQPDKVNVTRFSSRPGTAAEKLYDMPDRIKKERSRELTRLWLEVAARKNERYEGKILFALVTERGRDNTMKARANNYQGIVVKGNPRLGSFIKVVVTESNPFFLSGQIMLD